VAISLHIDQECLMKQGTVKGKEEEVKRETEEEERN
jgi:hypothetical protein